MRVEEELAAAKKKCVEAQEENKQLREQLAAAQEQLAAAQEEIGRREMEWIEHYRRLQAGPQMDLQDNM